MKGTNPRPVWFWFWMVWLGVFVGAETWAILDREPGDTLSESIWFLQRSWWLLTVILAVLLVWLFWHFIIDRRSRKRPTSIKQDDDIMETSAGSRQEPEWTTERRADP